MQRATRISIGKPKQVVSLVPQIFPVTQDSEAWYKSLDKESLVVPPKEKVKKPKKDIQKTVLDNQKVRAIQEWIIGNLVDQRLKEMAASDEKVTDLPGFIARLRQVEPEKPEEFWSNATLMVYKQLVRCGAILQTKDGRALTSKYKAIPESELSKLMNGGSCTVELEKNEQEEGPNVSSEVEPSE